MSMWALFFLANVTNTSVTTLTGFDSKEGCEYVRLQLEKAMPIRAAACIEFPQPRQQQVPPHVHE